MIRSILAVALGGAIGATGRFLIAVWFSKNSNSSLPLATFVANILGCFLIGLLTQASIASAFSPTVRVLLVTGLLGSLTTFSTFGLETLKCIHEQEIRLAVLNVAANVVLGLIAVSLGMGVGRLIWRV